MSKVSIIIPSYNQARYLAPAVESLLQQTHPDLEVVIVDDGSTDETPQVAARFADQPKVKYVRQENAGLPGARNRGLAESSGEYLCFLDSDDYYAPTKVAAQAQLLDENPGVGFVYCDIVTVDPQGQPAAEQFSIKDSNRVLSGDVFQSLMLGGYFPPHTVMIRRGVLEATGVFDPSLGGHADYELWLRVAGAGHKAVFLSEPLAFYRTHPESMSKDALHMTETRVATFQKIARLYPDRVAEGLNQLQQHNQDLHQANQWLHQRWIELSNRMPEDDASAPTEGNTYSLVSHLSEARQSKGQSDQKAVWVAKLDDVEARAIYLHPPAELTFQIPVGARGCFHTAIAIHPDAWDKPGAGGCEFHIRANGRMAYVLALDPTRLPSDRHWHEIKLEIPENANGSHQVTLETRAIGTPQSYRWALWRAPVFKWRDVTEGATAA